MKWKYVLLGAGGVLATAATAFQLERLRTETPRYRVVARHGDVEVREYPARIVAETVVEGATDREITSEGFRRLAGYIFGGNEGGASIAMTTPVERSEGTRIAMTTPVERASNVVAFTMPRRWTMESLPRPRDPRVTLREVPARTVAALRFSGRADATDETTQGAALLDAVRAAGLATTSSVTLAQYDPPWVIGPLRRNEVLVDLAP